MAEIAGPRRLVIRVALVVGVQPETIPHLPYLILADLPMPRQTWGLPTRLVVRLPVTLAVLPVLPVRAWALQALAVIQA